MSLAPTTVAAAAVAGRHLLRLRTGPPNTLQGLAWRLYTTMHEIPFQMSGSCRALVYRTHGPPAQVLALESGHVWQRHSPVRGDTDNPANSLVDNPADKLTNGPAVLVRMLAAPVNPADLNQLQGTYPLENALGVGGNEGVGVVEQTAGPHTRVQPGDLVIPRVPAFGTWREQVVCCDGDLQRIPADLPLDVAATLVVNPPTAYRLLADFVPLRAGDVIVQNGANSAVGRYVIQLARHRGIKTINIVRDRPDYEALEKELRALGATTVVKSSLLGTDETQAYLAALLGRRPILGLNCVGGIATTEMARLLAPSGTVVTYGGMAGKNPVVSAASMIFRDIRYCGFWMSRWYQQPENAGSVREQMFAEITQLFQQGVLTAPRLVHYDFVDWREAIERYTAGHASDAKPLLVMSRLPQ